MSFIPTSMTILAKLGYIFCFLLSWLDRTESQLTLTRPTPSKVPVDSGSEDRINYFWSDTIGSRKYQMHVYGRSKTTEKLFIFDPKGTTLRTPVSSELVGKVLAFIGKPGTGNLLAIYEDQSYDVFTLTESPPGTLISTKAAGAFAGFAGYKTLAASQTQNTNEVFLLAKKNPGDLEIFKFDYTSNKFNQAMQRSGLLGPANGADILENFGSEWLIFTDGSTRRIIVEKMGLYKLLDLTGQPASTLYVRNSHAGSEVYFSETSPTIQIQKYRFAIGGFAVAAISASGALTNAVNVGLLNVGSFNLLAGIIKTPQSVVVWDKTTFAQHASSPFTFVEPHIVLGRAIGAELSSLGNSFEFSIFSQQGSNNDAAFFSLLFDFCLTRDPVTLVCTLCPSTPTAYYRSSLLPNNYCITKPQFIGGFGADETNKVMVRCDSKGCQNCSNDYMVCVDCHNGGGYVLFNDKCYTKAELPAGKGFKAPDAVQNCLTGCLLCNYNADLCTKCDTGAGYYLNTGTSLCVLKSAFPASFGANLVTGEMAACATGCQTCVDNVFYCTVCTSGYFLTPNKVCLSNSQLPLGYRINSSTGLLETCADGCSQCPAASTSCTACFVSNNYVFSASKCLLMSSLPDGTGANLGTGVTMPCAVANCQKCRFDASKCELCFAKFNLNTATFASCTSDVITTFLQLETSDNPGKLAKVDVSIYISLDPPITPSSDNSAVLDLIKSKFNYTIQIFDPSGTAEEIPFKQTLVATRDVMQLDLTFTAPAKKAGKYQVTIGSNDSFGLEYKGNSYQVLVWSGSTVYESKASSDDLASAEAQAGAIGSLTPPTSASSASITLAMFAVISADPTGLLMRVSQILQVVSKLAFINVKYGPKLESFLSKIGEMFEGYKNPLEYSYIKHNRVSRGKLSQYGVHIDLVSKYALRLFAYLTCWFLKIGVALVPDDFKMPKWGLHVMFYIPKVHALIFNLVFFDLTFYSARTLLHSTGLPISTALAAISLILVALDFATLAGRIFDESAWAKLYYYLRTKEPKEGIFTLPPSEKESVDQTQDRQHFEKAMEDVPEEFMTSEESETEEEFKHRTSRQVDYLKTYTEIQFDYHMFDFMSEFLRVDKKVFSNIGARSYYALHVFRISLYHAIVVCGQYISTSVIVILALTELGKIIYTFYYYFKMRYLKFFVLVLVEISQSVMFGSFLIMILYYHLNNLDKELADSPQTIGLYLVVMSVAIEYILLILYVFFMLFHSLSVAKKAKEYRRKKNYVLGIARPKKPTFEYIHYLSRHQRKNDSNAKTIFVREIALKQFPEDESYDAMNKSVDPDSSIATFSKKRGDRVVKKSNKFARTSVQPARAVSKEISPQEMEGIPVAKPSEMISKIPQTNIMKVADKPIIAASESRNLKFHNTGKKGTVPDYLKDSDFDGSLKSKNTGVASNKTRPEKSLVKHSIKSVQPAPFEEDGPLRRQFIMEIRNSENNK